jgi:hypothetical protein
LILERTKTGDLTGSAALIRRNISMKDLVSYLFMFDSEGLPLVDDTGSTAIFDLNLTFCVSPATPKDDFNSELLRQKPSTTRLDWMWT